MAISRYCEQQIINDLKKKMVFIGGPRQVGKTTLARHLSENAFKNPHYLNWDIDEDRRSILEKLWSADDDLIIFDELHKYPRWKSWIKGVYDGRPENQTYLVTGSARLDIYKKGGDSLMGRYHYWRLHPFTLDEFPSTMTAQEAYNRLLTVGGFPEPFLLGDEREARRWQKERFDRILREDIRELDNVRNIQLLRLFLDALRARVGQLVTLSNLAEDLEIAPKTAKSWLSLIENTYIAFAIYPLTKNIPRAILKPPKVFFFDNADCTNDGGARLENLIATTLLKRIHYIEDFEGYKANLGYIRDKDGREVDFAVSVDGKLKALIEVKTSDETISTALKYYKDKLNPPVCYQVVGNLKRRYEKDGILVVNPIDFANEIAEKLL